MAVKLIALMKFSLNSLDKTATVAEVKRNKARFSAKLLNDKFLTIKREFAKYHDVRLIGLSMDDM